MDDTLFDSQNAAYAQAMFEQYARNPDSVPEAWRKLFEDGGSRAAALGLFVPEQLNGHQAAPAAAPATPDAADAAVPSVGSQAADHLRQALPVVSRATALIQAFHDHGHQLARIDPLGSDRPGHPQLSPAFFGTTMEELAELPASLVMDPEHGHGHSHGDDRSVADALNDLLEVYAGSIGYEFEHLDDHVKVDWLWEHVEAGEHFVDLPAERRKQLLRRLTEVEGLEQFLHRTYLGQKRFSIEGTDMLVPMLDLALEEAVGAGGREAVLGMAHRGRLNVLTHTVGVSYSELLAEFEGPSYKGGQLEVSGTGDVKYHHGANGTREIEGVGSIDVALMPNPSHLEFVNPVVAGYARAHQFGGPDKDAEPDPRAVVPILMHGDAAFAAEGVVAETLNMARLDGYDVGGTIHVIVNNQVGFTTDPEEGRSTVYASDLAKGYGIPVLHVNADDAEACLAAVRLAMAYRREFQDDFVIDLVGYRRHGHNEGDEPAYTQPRLYETIAEHPTARAVYAQRLVGEGVASEDEVEAMQNEVAAELRKAQEALADNGAGEEEEEPDEEDPVVPETTGVDYDGLEEINDAIVTVPDGFTPHPKLWKQMEKRTEGFSPDKALDWGHAEALAFGTLLKDGIPLRLTGQDSQRGTFSHRHMVLHDVETGD